VGQIWVQINREVSRATETPKELALAFGLATLGAACQKKFVIQPEEGYREPLSLWMVSALDPGNRKSAVQKEMIAPLASWEKTKAESLALEIREAASKRASQEARISELRKKAARATEENYLQLEQEIADIEATLTQVPQSPRLVVQDVTPEYLGEIMSEQDERISLISDEGGIFETIGGRYSGGIPNLDLFLQSHSGSMVRVDRRSRPTIHMDEPALTIGLSPQPDVLRGLSSKDGFRGRGLLGRFMFSIPRSRIGYRTNSQGPVLQSVREAYQNVIHKLLDQIQGKDDQGKWQPYRLELSQSAYIDWKTFQGEVEKEMRPGGRFHHIQDWSAKLSGAVLRMAGVLHCAEHADSCPWTQSVKSSTMMQALKLGEMFSQYALIVFDLMGMDDELGSARKVWSWIDSSKAAEFSRRECYRVLRGSFPKSEMLLPPLRLLEDRGYLKKAGDKKPGPGRKTEAYLVNPELVKNWYR